MTARKIIGVVSEYRDDNGKVISVLAENGMPIKTFFDDKALVSWINSNGYELKYSYITEACNI